MLITKRLLNYQKSSALNDNPLVSIIIGNYNYERFIKKAIDSALNQTYTNIEVIVVDDGSQDNSREVIANYGNKIITIFKENGGQHSNYNVGFAASKGEIICFLDSDDWFIEDKVEKIVKIFQSSEKVDWCFHSVKLVDAKNNSLPMTTTENYVTKECDFRNHLKSGKIPPHLPPCSALCFRRSLLKKILPMPTPKAVSSSDHYVKFMAVALSQGFILNDQLTVQKIHGNNAATLRKDKDHLRGRKYIYTGLWIKQEFTNFRKFADKMIAVGTALNWQSGTNDSENNQAIKKYLTSASLIARLKITFISLYYYIKNKYASQ